jgi:hypothetical protein
MRAEGRREGRGSACEAKAPAAAREVSAGGMTGAAGGGGEATRYV